MNIKPKLQRLWKQALTTMMVCLLVGTISYSIGATTVIPSTAYIMPGVFPGAPSYTVWTEGTGANKLYYAKDGNGQIKFFGTNPTQLINQLVAPDRSILVKVGLYELPTSLTITYPTGLSNFILRGEGVGTIFRMASGANQERALYIYATHHALFENFQVDGESSTQTQGHGIDVVLSYGITLRSIYVNDAHQNGLQLYESFDITLDNIISESNMGYNYMIYGSHRSRVINSQSFNGNYSGFMLMGQSHDIQFVGCISRNESESGFYVNDGSYKVTFSSCISQDEKMDGFLFYGQLARVYDITMTACIAYGSDTGDGIAIDTASNINIEGGIFRNNAGRGILVTTNSYDITILGPLLMNNDQATLDLGGLEIIDSSDITVVGIRAFDDQTPKTQDYGIRESGSSDYNIFESCNAIGNDDAGIIVIGANSYVVSSFYNGTSFGDYP